MNSIKIITSSTTNGIRPEIKNLSSSNEVLNLSMKTKLGLSRLYDAEML